MCGPSWAEELDEQTKGETVVHCLEGRVACTAGSMTHTLEGGKLLLLPAGEPYAVKGIENSSLLVTMHLSKR